MSKISDLNYSQHITLADNFKQKSEVLNTWRVGMNDFARIAGGQDSRRNILSPGAFLAFLAKRSSSRQEIKYCFSPIDS